ncbi:MAG TPA: 2-hydroxychromene-2-carboxylate isomerase [Gammaproteobacteria bacterium]|nr:2-hydroxychromene-2-carboxylate isomerase [Gammaproteobacteria bacterium]
MKSPIKACWYFDLVSPYSYLHLEQFHNLPANLEIDFVPVLFAGLLKYWENKGPAEIPAKRIYTYRHVTWLAQKLGIPFKVPPSHPFNSLPALRLLIAAGLIQANVATAFEMIWKEGRDLQNPKEIAVLASRLGIMNLQATLTNETIKLKLRANTADAVTKGIFGVPTFAINNLIFWGQDSLDMMLDYLHDFGLFETPEMQHALTLPVGASRREVSKP